MPKKKPPEKDDKPQKERFKEAAKSTGADESGQVFERAFRGLVLPTDAKDRRDRQ